LPIVQSFGRYKIVEELGRGAMGVVYRATDPLIGRPVAIKVINQDYLASVGVEAGEYFERFRREAEVAGRLSHPGIVKIFDLGPNFLVMEFIEGQTLAALMRSHSKQQLSSVLRIVSQAASALDYAHGQGITHRDVKPANLMIEPGGSVRVMDFGLARIDSSTLTTAGEILGSASYMAPEVVLGRPATPRSDIFSLGVVAYELMAGDRPFGGASISSIIHSIVESTPKPVHTLNLSLPPEYDDIFARALAKDPAARFPSAGAFAEALVQKRWADRDPTITAPVPEVSVDAETVQEGPAIREAALAAAQESKAATSAGAPPPGPPPAGEATIVMTAPVAGRSAPPTVILEAAGGDRTGPAPTPHAPPSHPRRTGLFVGIALGCGTLLVLVLTAGFFLSRHLLHRPTEPVLPTPADSPSSEPPPSAPPPTAEPPSPQSLPPPSEAPPPAATVPAVATLSVTSEPAGARVTLGRKSLGATPLRLQLPAGSGTIAIEKDGFLPWHGDVTLRAGVTESLRAKLEPVPSPLPPPPTPAPRVRTGDLVPLTDDVVPPKKIAGDSPRLPSSKSGLRSGSAVVEFTVTEEGAVLEPRIVESAGALLDRACLDAVQRWRYEPATKDGVRVKVVQRTRFRFEFK
jgi:TonB family protein